MLDEATYIEKRTASSQVTFPGKKTSHATHSGATLSLPNGISKTPSAPLVDLLDLSSDDAPQMSSSTNNFLHDLLGVGLDVPSTSGAYFSFLNLNKINFDEICTCFNFTIPIQNLINLWSLLLEEILTSRNEINLDFF